ncbi:TolB family protein [Gordonia phosphorivorans]|uniref:TolB family protein n=1 Tax=Gordonia phosphorivorans TaxID=1056982 RepID=A0ABV6HCA9_9ACTN
MLRSDATPPGIHTQCGPKGVVGRLGDRLLPWRAFNISEVAPSPTLRAVAMVMGAYPGAEIELTEYGSRTPMESLPGFTVMDNRGSSICGVDWSPDGRTLACLEWSGVGVLTLLDAQTGRRTVLTTLDKIMGNEVPRFSPDGRWILVPTSAPKLVSLDQSVSVSLPLEHAYVDWWPARGPSALFAIVGHAGSQHFGAYDLASGRFEDLGPLQLPHQPDLPETRALIHTPRVSPVGGHVLVGSWFGPPGPYQEENGSRERVAVLDVTTGQVTSPIYPWADAGSWLERDHSKWFWTGRPSTTTGPTVVAPALFNETTPFDNNDLRAHRDATDRDELVVVWSW